MRVAVIIASSRPGWSTRRLYEALKRRGHRPAYVDIREVWARVGDGEVTVWFRRSKLDPDVAIVRAIGANLTLDQLLARISLLAALEDAGVPVVNPWRGILAARNKMLSVLAFLKAGLRVPETLLAETLPPLLRFVSGNPVVVKPLAGSLGLGSFLARDEDTLYHIASLYLSTGRPVYAQRLVEKKDGRDVRVFVVDGRVVAAAERIPPRGSWKTNVARGGEPIPAHLDEEEAEAAVRAAEALGLLYAGVDLARDSHGNLYVFEANAMPNWRGLYMATGVDPADEITRLLERVAKRGGEE